MKKPARLINFSEDYWNTQFTVLWNVNREEFCRFVGSEYGIPEEHCDVHTGSGLCFVAGNTHERIILAFDMEKFTGSPNNYNFLSHEVLHAIFYIMKSRGVKLSNKSEEVFTYGTGSLVERLATLMLDKEKTLKKRRLARK